jgi:predicted O-methyltransferase YrrM
MPVYTIGMTDATDVLYEFDTDYGHYQVVDMIYDGRPARVLFSGERRAAQSGLATDDNDDLLFDYNQRMFELVAGHHPKRLLLIGGGMYTLPMALLAELPDIIIDVVELDNGLEPVARQYFGLDSNERLRIIHDDGLTFIATNDVRYDMILIDAYSHDLAEPSLGSAEAVSHLTRALTPGGVIVSNVIASYFGRRSQALRRLMDHYQEQQYGDVALFPASQSLSLWLPQNLILTAQLSAETNLDQHLRYQRLADTTRPFNLSRDLMR